jgi:hypothetical protein
VPETWVQATVVLALVVPGFVYQVSSQTVAGPDPAQSEFGTRVLRAIVSTAAFAGGYAVVFGSTILSYLHDPGRAIGAVPVLGMQFVALGLLIPWFVARLRLAVLKRPWYQRVVTGRWLRALHLHRTPGTTPTAWDHAFAERAPGWVRVRLANGQWLGGWYGESSFASSFPHAHELFVEEGWALRDDGSFSSVRYAPSGLLIDCGTALSVDFVPPSGDTADGGSDEHEDGAP